MAQQKKTVKAIIFDAYGTLYDVQSVTSDAETCFPGYGSLISQIWRLKQLEYSWLRSMMGCYADFRTVTRESLTYTLNLLGLPTTPDDIDKLAAGYNSLDLYPDAKTALQELSAHRLAILSNGSPAMLRTLLSKDGLLPLFEAIISVDEARAYKPDPRCYHLATRHLDLSADSILFVTSNGFDICGARNFGFTVARVARVGTETVRAELQTPASVGPAAMFRALRSQPENLGTSPDMVLNDLGELAARLAQS